MGKIAGFKYRDIIRKIKKFGFEFYRQAAGSHEIWYNPSQKKFTTIPNHQATCPKERLEQY
jgi:predicted RNA binding protein YcfA (HicA-like mRNA interferase family)